MVDCEILPNGHHSESLIAALDRMLNRNHHCLEHVDQWLINLGPGSFTGLRIALATVKAMTLVYPRPILTVDGSEIRALSGWSDKAKAQGITVLTQLTPQRWLQTDFAINEKKLLPMSPKTHQSEALWQPQPGFLVITDEGTDEPLRKRGLNPTRIIPTAGILLENFARCISLKWVETIKDQRLLAPNYYPNPWIGFGKNA